MTDGPRSISPRGESPRPGSSSLPRLPEPRSQVCSQGRAAARRRPHARRTRRRRFARTVWRHVLPARRARPPRRDRLSGSGATCAGGWLATARCRNTGPSVRDLLRSRQPRRADSPHPAPPRLSAQRERSQEGSLKATVGRLAAASIPPPQIAALLQRLRIEPVFTAHPTEATRRTLLEKEQVIGRLLVERLDPSRTPDEERAVLARIREEVTAAWQTDPHPSTPPTVMDALENVVFYLTDIVYRIVPPFSEELEQAVH